MINSLYPCFEKWQKTDGLHDNAIWLYSDPHFNDPDSEFFRKDYPGDNEQVRRINNKVGRTDTIIFLGDIGDLAFLKKIHGYKVLIAGNHDTGLTALRRKSYTIGPFNAEPYLDKHYQELDDRFMMSISDFTSVNNSEEAALQIELEKLETKAWKTAVSDVRKTSDHDLDFALWPSNLDMPTYHWIEKYDNHLFDEIYSGTLQISSKIILSHEPVDYQYCFNIHGHTHGTKCVGENHLNICAEYINYTPVNLKKLINSGILKSIPDIHRTTIDLAVAASKK